MRSKLPDGIMAGRATRARCAPRPAGTRSGDARDAAQLAAEPSGGRDRAQRVTRSRAPNRRCLPGWRCSSSGWTARRSTRPSTRRAGSCRRRCPPGRLRLRRYQRRQGSPSADVVEQGDGLAEVLGRAGVVLVIPFRSSRSPTSCSASSASTPSSSADSATSTGLSACLRSQLRRLRHAVQRVLSGRGHAKRGHDGLVPDTSAADWRALRVVASGHAWRQSVVERVGRRVDAHVRS